MAQIVLPVSAALRNPKTERQAILLRLRQLGVAVAGEEQMETAWLKDLLQKEEVLAANRVVVPRLTVPDPAHVAGILKEIKEFNEHRTAGTKKYY